MHCYVECSIANFTLTAAESTSFYMFTPTEFARARVCLDVEISGDSQGFVQKSLGDVLLALFHQHTRNPLVIQQRAASTADHLQQVAHRVRPVSSILEKLGAFDHDKVRRKIYFPRQT